MYKRQGLELPVKLEYNETLAVEAFALAARWEQAIAQQVPVGDSQFSPRDMEGWNTNQVVVFLERLHAGPKVPGAYTSWLDDVYKLSTAHNTEIRLRFYELALEDKHGMYAKQAADWVRVFAGIARKGWGQCRLTITGQVTGSHEILSNNFQSSVQGRAGSSAANISGE